MTRQDMTSYPQAAYSLEVEGVILNAEIPD
jgi:hypothetical protein